MNCKPKVRMYRPKKSQPKSRVLWRSGRVIKRGKDYAELKQQCFDRGGGYCECWRIAEKSDQTCMGLRRIFFGQFDLHHVKHGIWKSDELEGVIAVRRECHERLHPGPQWTKAA